MNLAMRSQVIIMILMVSFIEFSNEFQVFSWSLSVEAGLTSLKFG